MNYRHAYHAGNFADVVKHVILSRVIAYTQRKDAPCLLLDTHAGIGRYDLASVEATKTGEAESGIKRFVAALANADARTLELLEPYRAILDAMNPDGGLGVVPGSAEVMSRMRRTQDRCVFNELHPEDARKLASRYGRLRKTETLADDAIAVLRAKLPPSERRGVILVDPPFEKPSEVDDIIAGIRDALKRFATGIYLIWYPLKDQQTCALLRNRMAALGSKSALDTALFVKPEAPNVFAGSGMVILNPPYLLREELDTLLPFLAGAMADEPSRGKWATDWLVAPD